MHQLLELWRQNCNTAGTLLLWEHNRTTACIQFLGDRSTQKTKPRRGDAGPGNAGAVSHDRQGQGAVARHLKPTSSFARQQTGGGNTHRADSRVPSSPSLTSSFSLLPSYCVGGSANRKVRVNEWREEKKKQHGKVIQSSSLQCSNHNPSSTLNPVLESVQHHNN